jgi:hypothetical protein
VVEVSGLVQRGGNHGCYFRYFAHRMSCGNKVCPDCGSQLYRTRLNQKWFCRECWEYKLQGESAKVVL